MDPCWPNLAKGEDSAKENAKDPHREPHRKLPNAASLAADAVQRRTLGRLVKRPVVGRQRQHQQQLQHCAADLGVERFAVSKNRTRKFNAHSKLKNENLRNIPKLDKLLPKKMTARKMGLNQGSSTNLACGETAGGGVQTQRFDAG